MQKKASEPSTDEGDYFTVVASYTDMEVSIFPAVKKRWEVTECLFPGLEDEVFFNTPLLFSYSLDGGEWVDVEGGEELPENNNPNTTIVSLNKGSRLRVKAVTTELANEEDGVGVVVWSSSPYDVDGNTMSLIFGDDFRDKYYIPHKYCVPTFTYAEYATDDNKLIKILQPDIFLPAIDLCEGCYRDMFSHCISLTNSPTLPAVTLYAGCYSFMFSDCASLTKAPELPASTLVDRCYYGMFEYCEKLSYIKMLATDVSADSCLVDWVFGVSDSGTFVKHPDMTSLPVGVDGIPKGWTVLNDGEEEGGNDFGIWFPLYLEFDYCEESVFSKYCERAADELGVKVYNCVKSIVDEYGEGDGIVTDVGEQMLDMLGIEIYFENSKVIGLYKDHNTYSMTTNGEYSYVYVLNNGLMSYEL